MMILKKNISIPGNQQKPPKKRETKAFRLISNLLNAQGPDGRLTSTKEKQRSFSTQTDDTITKTTENICIARETAKDTD